MKILLISSLFVLTASLLPVSPILATKYSGEFSPAQMIPIRRSAELVNAGEDACKLGNYEAAESDFKAAKLLMEENFAADRGLAEALTGEGNSEEAVQVYQTLLTPNPHIGSSITQEVRTQMGFAIVLSRTGRWQEAVAVYEKALPTASHFGDAPKIDIHFDPQVPMPAQLQALAHVAIGIEYTGYSDTERAFSEYEKAIQSDPNSAFTNYYYGYGWHSLDPKDQVRITHAQQAQAALEKAVKIGNADVKAAAAKALKNAG